MPTRFPVKSPRLFVCILAAACCLPAAESKSDDAENAAPSATESMIGKKPGEVRDDNGLKMKLVWCPPGKFTMGSPESENGLIGNDQVEVTLTTGFWLGKYEVTRSEWKQMMQTEPWKGSKFMKEGEEFPVTCFSWNDATDFCRKLTEQERLAGRLSNDWEYTLPTEAQWEWGCRARTSTRFSFGDDESKLGDYAWFSANASKAGEGYAHPVGQKKANPWGLCDMHGNVWEWCRDIYAEKLPGGRDPGVKPDEKTDASDRVFRGGGWYFDAARCRSAYRSRGLPGTRYGIIGFRPALSPVRPDK